MAYEPLHHKYRPQVFADLVGQEAIARTLVNALKTKRIATAYLFTGARGTGKTSSARIMAKSLNCLASDQPTPDPCGVCELCRAVTVGTALDITEIDAASNTGVDNIRELIERAQFAPVQARYKIYVIDECLTGDSLISTDQGAIRIDDPNIAARKVLSYNDALNQWEFKQVVRWFDQGERQTFMIETDQYKLKCTENHLIRTETGWIAAKNVREGMKILSPVNADAAPPFTSSVWMGGFADLFQDTSLRETPLDRKNTTLTLFWQRLSHFVHSVNVDVVRDLTSLISWQGKGSASPVFYPTGINIHLSSNTGIGRIEQRNMLPNLVQSLTKIWDSSTELFWGMAQFPSQISTAGSQDYPGIMGSLNRNGWNIKPADYQNYAQSSELLSTKVMENNLSVAVPLAIPNSSKCMKWSSPKHQKNESQWTGSVRLPLKELLGGIWMMDRLASVPKAVLKFSFILKAIHHKRINYSLTGFQNWATQPSQSHIKEPTLIKFTTTFGWEQTRQGNGSLTLSNILFPKWNTSLETVKSVCLGGIERVYDIEVEDNHNFVANGLLVHNCHMLSTAAFNALLKTLEEPPDRVVFILATTDPQRVLPTIISRCQRFDFRRIPLEAMVSHLTKIAKLEKIAIAPEAVTLISQISQGGLRDAESLLDQLSLLEGEISPEAVWDLVGVVPERDLLAILTAIANSDSTELLEQTRRVMDRGREPIIVLQNLASCYRDLLIAQTSDRRDLVALTDQGWQNLQKLAKSLSRNNILHGQQHLRQAEVQIKNTTQPRLWLEIILLGLLPSELLTQAIAEKPKLEISQNVQVLPKKELTVEPGSEIQIQAQPTFQKIPQSTSPIVQPIESPKPNQQIQPSEAVIEPIEKLPNPPDLSGQWQNLMRILSPVTKGILERNAKFVSVDGDLVKIGIKNTKLKEIAEGKKSEILKHCEQLFGRKVQVSFVTAKLTVSDSESKTSSQTSSQARTQVLAQVKPSANIVPENLSSAIAQPIKPDTKTEPIPASIPNVTPEPKPEIKSPPSLEVIAQKATSNKSISYQDNVQEFAIKNVASFFNGQIVDLDQLELEDAEEEEV